jgi:hypothetical protein
MDAVSEAVGAPFFHAGQRARIEAARRHAKGRCLCWPQPPKTSFEKIRAPPATRQQLFSHLAWFENAKPDRPLSIKRRVTIIFITLHCEIRAA